MYHYQNLVGAGSPKALSCLAKAEKPAPTRRLAPTAVKVALFIGTILLIINHGYALFRGQMTSDRWISVLLTYCMPYLVNIHGQYISNSRKK
ncbi:nitrate/nitrite transporter NrtS [Phormidium nigroviride]